MQIVAWWCSSDSNSCRFWWAQSKARRRKSVVKTLLGNEVPFWCFHSLECTRLEASWGQGILVSCSHSTPCALEQCLTHSGSINICWIEWINEQMNASWCIWFGKMWQPVLSKLPYSIAELSWRGVSYFQEVITVRVQDPRVQNEGSWNSYVDYKIFLHVSASDFCIGIHASQGWGIVLSRTCLWIFLTGQRQKKRREERRESLGMPESCMQAAWWHLALVGASDQECGLVA